MKASRIPKFCWLGTLLLCTLLLSCVQPSEETALTIKKKVFVSIVPQAYFAERVGNPYVDVEVLVKPGESPERYDPSPSQLMRLDEADFLFTIGVPFEEMLLDRLKAGRPKLHVVHAEEGIEYLPFMDHWHPEGEECHGHHHGDIDPHIWLDPIRMKRMAENICNAYIRVDPERERFYRANLELLHRDLDELDARIAQTLEPVRGRTILVYHPAFGYFAQRYGLIQRAVETGGKEPGPATLARLIEEAKAHKVRVIFVQRQFSETSARAVARQIGGTVVSMDPLEWDYILHLERMAETIRSAIMEGDGEPGK